MVHERKTEDVARAIRETLLASRHQDGGWGYTANGPSRLEPTAWASLALGHSLAGAAFVRACHSVEGLLADPGAESINLTVNALAALAMADVEQRGASRPARSIAESILRHAERAAAPAPDMYHDGSAEAWPWTSETARWVESTSWSVLAIKKVHRAADRSAGHRALIQDAERHLVEHAGRSWNTGPTTVVAGGAS